MFIDDVLSYVYPVNEGDLSGNPAVIKLGMYLRRIFSQPLGVNGPLSVRGVEPTVDEVMELNDIYNSIIRDHVALETITTFSQNIMNILKGFGFKVQDKDSGWTLSEGVVDESYDIHKDEDLIEEVLKYLKTSKVMIEGKYTFNDLPEWAKPIVKSEFGEKQTYIDMYKAGDMVELSYKEGGDFLTFRVYKDGTVTER